LSAASGAGIAWRSVLRLVSWIFDRALDGIAACGDATYPSFFQPPGHTGGVAHSAGTRPEIPSAACVMTIAQAAANPVGEITTTADEALRSIDLPPSDSTIITPGPSRSGLRSTLRSCRWAWVCLALLTIGTAAAQTAPSQMPDQGSIFGEEPITPIPPPPAADPLKLALGERLFTDPRLSHDGSRSCSSCHDTRTNGADGNRLDKAPDGSDLPLNTNTVFNAALSFRIGWEGSFPSLEAQAEASLTDPAFMATSFDEVLGRLSADADIARQFDAAYGHGPDRASLLDAIATYERSLVTPGSRFDRWLDGDAEALTAEEQAGYGLFKSLRCVSCHQGVNVGGNLFERHGIFHPLAAPKPEILRVPSLRNITTTPPYFHDGSAPALGDAVRRMAAGQLNQTLSDQQVAAIVAFLGTLTGTYHDRLVTAAAP
jgi:cytochrome c peroxidase